jgi:hypothetical protein
MYEHTTTKFELTMMWVLCKQATIANCTLLQAYYSEVGTERMRVWSTQATSAPCIKFKFTLMQVCGNKVLVHFLYRVIHKSLWDFQPLWYRSQDGHAEGEHVNRERETPSFCPTLQVLDMSTLGYAADVNPVIKFLPHTLQHLAVNSSNCLHDPSSQLW